MYEIIILIVILVLITIWYKKKNCGSCPRKRCRTQVFPRISEATGERSMSELEADCSSAIERADFPDLINSMWKAERSFPELDEKGRYSSPWNDDDGKHIWNRFPIENFGGMKGLVHATFPTKDVNFS